VTKSSMSLIRPERADAVEPDSDRSPGLYCRPVRRADDGRPTLTVEGLIHRYGDVPVLHGIDFTIGRGEILCLVGPSGCGKTTTLRIVAGLEQPVSGRIVIDDRTVFDADVDLSPENRNVGLMFQDFALFPHMRVIDNVGFGIRDVKGAAKRDRCMAALAEVGLADHARSYPHMLSGGQQQRVALVRALAPRPGLMLLDEPFSGLDSQLRSLVRDETMHLLKETGAATLLVTHEPEEAMFMADRIAVMRAGRVEQIGTPEEIYCEPVNAFVASFFGEVNRLEGAVRAGIVHTPLGPVDAPGFADGANVCVLIRPEAIRLARAGAETSGRRHARVQAARMLGRSTLVHLTLQTIGGYVHLHARVPGRFRADENDILAVSLDDEQTFVFSAEGSI